MPRKKNITVYGTTFKSIADAARHFHLSPHLVHLRLRRGHHPEAAFSSVPLTRIGKAKSIVVKGRSFPTIKAAAEEFGIPHNRALARLKHGWSPEEALGLTLHKVKSMINLRISGQSFPSISSAARYFGVDAKMVIARYRQYGWTIEQALGLKDWKGRGRKLKIEVKGKKFESVADAARHFHLNKGTVYSRLQKGWTIAQALELASRPRPQGVIGYVYCVTHKATEKSYIGATKKTPSERWEQHISQAGKSKYVKRGSFQEAIIRYGKEAFRVTTLARAKTLAELDAKEMKLIRKHNTKVPNGFNISKGGAGTTVSKGTAIIVKGKTFASYSQAGEWFGLSPYKIRERIASGWTPEQAVGIKDKPIRYGKMHSIKIEGIKYPTIKEAAKAYGLRVGIVRNRIHMGWNPERALKTPVDPTTKGKRVRIGKRTFSSLSEASRRLRVDRKTLCEWLNKGVNIEEKLLLRHE